jgi:hypothetical protein
VKTQKKSRIETISTSKHSLKSNCQTEQGKNVFKVADFKNQELLLDVFAESPDISYHPEHLELMSCHRKESKPFEQKFSLKL